MDNIYSLDSYYRELDEIARSGARVESIGKSTLGREIYAVHKGQGDGAEVLVHATIHAREYLTTPLVLHLMREYEGDTPIVCLPCVNIDGMALVLEGLSSLDSEARREYIIRANGGSTDMRYWKANANAVDLNVNFNANWGRGKSNIRHPNSANYIGEYPLSEVENRILAGITLRLQPRITLSYHTKGNVIYEGYESRKPYHAIAEHIANFINYDLMESKGSYGGYKDWFVATTPYLGLTIECGSDELSYPLPLNALEEMKRRQSGLLAEVARLCQYIH